MKSLIEMTIFNRLINTNWLFAALMAILLVACSEVQEKDLNNNQVAPPPPEPKKEEVKKNPVPSEDEYTEAKVDLGLTKEDTKYLLLQEAVPLGTTSHAIHDKIPSIKGVRPEGGSDELAAQGLTEAKTKVTILGKPTDLEVNFKNDSLYSFYYTIVEPDFNKAEKTHKGIQQFYNKKIGQGTQLPSEEETKNIITTVWTQKYPYAVMTYNVNTGLISWGFQNTKP